MMTMHSRTGVVLGGMLVSALLLFSCGGKVVIEGEYAGQGGAGDEGNGAGPTSSGDTTSTSSESSGGTTSGGSPLCGTTETSCTGLGTDVCKCSRPCGDTTLKVSCSPDPKGVIICICSYDMVFSGTCFKKSENV